jgi:hypothetical protein
VPSTTITKVAGLVLGAVACAALLVSPRISRPAGVVDAALTLTASPTGELAVTPIGTVLDSGRLAPGAPAARGTMVVRNQTGIPLAVRLRAKPVTGDLDDVVRLRIRDADHTLFDGSLARLRSGTRPIGLAPGAGQRLRIAATLRAHAPDGFEGRTDEVALELTSTTTGGLP